MRIRWNPAVAALLAITVPATGRAQQSASFPRADGATVPARVYRPSADSCCSITLQAK